MTPQWPQDSGWRPRQLLRYPLRLLGDPSRVFEMGSWRRVTRVSPPTSLRAEGGSLGGVFIFGLLVARLGRGGTFKAPSGPGHLLHLGPWTHYLCSPSPRPPTWLFPAHRWCLFQPDTLVGAEGSTDQSWVQGVLGASNDHQLGKGSLPQRRAWLPLRGFLDGQLLGLDPLLLRACPQRLPPSSCGPCLPTCPCPQAIHRLSSDSFSVVVKGSPGMSSESSSPPRPSPGCHPHTSSGFLQAAFSQAHPLMTSTGNMPALAGPSVVRAFWDGVGRNRDFLFGAGGDTAFRGIARACGTFRGGAGTIHEGLPRWGGGHGPCGAFRDGPGMARASGEQRGELQLSWMEQAQLDFLEVAGTAGAFWEGGGHSFCTESGVLASSLYLGKEGWGAGRCNRREVDRCGLRVHQVFPCPAATGTYPCDHRSPASAFRLGLNKPARHVAASELEHPVGGWRGREGWSVPKRCPDPGPSPLLPRTRGPDPQPLPQTAVQAHQPLLPQIQLPWKGTPCGWLCWNDAEKSPNGCSWASLGGGESSLSPGEGLWNFRWSRNAFLDPETAFSPTQRSPATPFGLSQHHSNTANHMESLPRQLYTGAGANLDLREEGLVCLDCRLREGLRGEGAGPWVWASLWALTILPCPSIHLQGALILTATCLAGLLRPLHAVSRWTALNALAGLLPHLVHLLLCRTTHPTDYTSLPPSPPSPGTMRKPGLQTLYRSCGHHPPRRPQLLHSSLTRPRKSSCACSIQESCNSPRCSPEGPGHTWPISEGPAWTCIPHRAPPPLMDLFPTRPHGAGPTSEGPTCTCYSPEGCEISVPTNPIPEGSDLTCPAPDDTGACQRWHVARGKKQPEESQSWCADGTQETDVVEMRTQKTSRDCPSLPPRRSRRKRHLCGHARLSDPGGGAQKKWVKTQELAIEEAPQGQARPFSVEGSPCQLMIIAGSKTPLEPSSGQSTLGSPLSRCLPCQQWAALPSAPTKCPLEETPAVGREQPLLGAWVKGNTGLQAEVEGTCVQGPRGPLKVPPRPKRATSSPKMIRLQDSLPLPAMRWEEIPGSPVSMTPSQKRRLGSPSSLRGYLRSWRGANQSPVATAGSSLEILLPTLLEIESMKDTASKVYIWGIVFPFRRRQCKGPEEGGCMMCWIRGTPGVPEWELHITWDLQAILSTLGLTLSEPEGFEQNGWNDLFREVAGEGVTLGEWWEGTAMTQAQDDGGLEKRGGDGGVENNTGKAQVKEAVHAVGIREKIKNSVLDILILRCLVGCGVGREHMMSVGGDGDQGVQGTRTSQRERGRTRLGHPEHQVKKPSSMLRLGEGRQGETGPLDLSVRKPEWGRLKGAQKSGITLMLRRQEERKPRRDNGGDPDSSRPSPAFFLQQAQFPVASVADAGHSTSVAKCPEKPSWPGSPCTPRPPSSDPTLALSSSSQAPRSRVLNSRAGHVSLSGSDQNYLYLYIWGGGGRGGGEPAGRALGWRRDLGGPHRPGACPNVPCTQPLPLAGSGVPANPAEGSCFSWAGTLTQKTRAPGRSTNSADPGKMGGNRDWIRGDGQNLDAGQSEGAPENPQSPLPPSRSCQPCGCWMLIARCPQGEMAGHPSTHASPTKPDPNCYQNFLGKTLRAKLGGGVRDDGRRGEGPGPRREDGDRWGREGVAYPLGAGPCLKGAGSILGRAGRLSGGRVPSWRGGVRGG
ncbi:Protein FAM71E2 [Camelus dromedarius]|uniref:Protein FAM71E2 n=1 Tax=Camelus dromedarius TaxID=9838 RepID=A0A5N4DTD3_CAMDR|nr:Protein FAM71E2 [Camelus dromedarius]